MGMSEMCRYCCKSRKSKNSENLARVDSSMVSLLQGPVGSIRRPVVDLVRNDVVPRRRVQNAPASLKNFIGQSKKTFSTLSVNSGLTHRRSYATAATDRLATRSGAGSKAPSPRNGSPTQFRHRGIRAFHPNRGEAKRILGSALAHNE
jgi:hypothetical protein